jgi:hypothetical protein
MNVTNAQCSLAEDLQFALEECIAEFGAKHAPQNGVEEDVVLAAIGMLLADQDRMQSGTIDKFLYMFTKCPTLLPPNAGRG